jgi:hypothetical protein
MWRQRLDTLVDRMRGERSQLSSASCASCCLHLNSKECVCQRIVVAWLISCLLPSFWDEHLRPNCLGLSIAHVPLGISHQRTSGALSLPMVLRLLRSTACVASARGLSIRSKRYDGTQTSHTTSRASHWKDRTETIAAYVQNFCSIFRILIPVKHLLSGTHCSQLSASLTHRRRAGRARSR